VKVRRCKREEGGEGDFRCWILNFGFGNVALLRSVSACSLSYGGLRGLGCEMVDGI